VIAVNIADAFSFEPEDFSRLRAGGDLHFDFAFERRDVDLRAQGRLNEADGDFADNVQALSDKKRMRLDLDYDIEIARRTAGGAGFSLVAEL